MLTSPGVCRRVECCSHRRVPASLPPTTIYSTSSIIPLHASKHTSDTQSSQRRRIRLPAMVGPTHSLDMERDVDFATTRRTPTRSSGIRRRPHISLSYHDQPLPILVVCLSFNENISNGPIVRSRLRERVQQRSFVYEEAVKDCEEDFGERCRYCRNGYGTQWTRASRILTQLSHSHTQVASSPVCTTCSQ